MRERSFIRQPQQHVAMTRLRCTPANEVAPAKAIELRQQIRLLCEPVFIFRNDIRATSVSADQERIAPYGRPTDVDRIGGRPAELFLVQHLWRLCLLHRSDLSAVRLPEWEAARAAPLLLVRQRVSVWQCVRR